MIYCAVFFVYVYVLVERSLSFYFPAVFVPWTDGSVPGFTRYYSSSSSSSSSMLKVSIIDVTHSETTEKARPANAFVLTPVQKHVPSYVLAISPLVKGQDFATVGNWFIAVLNYGGRHHLPVIGIDVDGDSKFRKYFMEEFLTRAGMNRTMSIPYRGFDFQSVVKDIDGLTVPRLMFPDWKHLIRKKRNQI